MKLAQGMLVLAFGFGFGTMFGFGVLGTAPAATLDFRSVDLGEPTSLGNQVYSAAWGDFDGDGRPDLYLSTLFDAPAALFRNTTNGFVRVAGPDAGTDVDSRAGATWADVDDDGDLDLFVGTTRADLAGGVLRGADDVLYLNEGGTGTFRKVAGAPWEGSAGFGQSAVAADFDGDGGVDFFVPNGGGWTHEPNALYRSLGAGSFTRESMGPMVEEVLASSGAAAGDYDGDGRMDLFVAHIGSDNSLFHNLGGGLFEKVPALALAGEPPQAGAASAVWADYDNDGDLDLFVVHGAPRCFLYRNDGGGAFTSVDVPPLTEAAGDTVGAAFADFDNDGWLDVVVARRRAGQWLFRGTGAGKFEAVTTGPIAEQNSGANGVAVADVDLDGNPDVFFSNWDEGIPPTFFRNAGSSNGWLRVRLEGAGRGLSNTAGIGAKVRVRATIGGRTLWQLRQVGGEDAQGSGELVAHFGLGDAVAAELVRVEWPSGFVQVLTNVVPRQVLNVAESPVTVSAAPGLNRQTGLFEQRVRLERVGAGATNGIGLYAIGLPADVTLLNAVGRDELGPYVVIDPASGSPAVTELVLTYRRSSRAGFDSPVFRVRPGVAERPAAPEGPRLAVSRTDPLPEGGVLVEFTAEPGATYAVEYSDDLEHWRPAAGTVLAGGTRARWIDHGPPDTPALPSKAVQRSYRVVRRVSSTAR